MSFTAAPRRAPTELPASIPDSVPRRSGWGSGGGGASSRTDFDPAAAAAFGKKPARVEAPPSELPAPVVTHARNTLASALDGLLPDDPPPKQKQWSKSALQQQREAAKAEAIKKAQPAPKTYEEEFPTLGGGPRAVGGAGAAGAVKVPKPVISMTPDSKKAEGGTSFAALAANWAKEDEEKKYAESLAAKERARQQSIQEFENANRVRIYRNLNSNRMFDGGAGYYDEESGEGYYNDEGGYDDGFGEEEQSVSAMRAEKRAVARRYEYEQGYDEEEEEEYEY